MGNQNIYTIDRFDTQISHLQSEFYPILSQPEMAAASLCSLPTQSPALPSVSLSSVSSIPSLKPHSANPPFSAKLGLNLVGNDSPEIEVVAMEAAREYTPAETAGRVEGSDGGDGNGGLGQKRRERGRRVKSGYLSREEEAELCLCLKEAAQLEAARTRIMETQEHEPTNNQLAIAMGTKIRCIDKILCKGRESRERLICSYSKLVVSIAAPYQGKGLSLQDLIQEGNIGLLRGAERFDPDRGHKLSTYAYWWIKQAIIRALDNKSRLVRFPGHMGQMVARIAEATNLLSRKLMRVPTHDETAEFLNVNVSTIRLVLESTRHPISLSQSLTDRGCLTLQEIMPGPNHLTPETMVMRKLVKQEVKRLLNTLSRREEYILRLYFGLNGQIPQSFEEIGKSLNLSRETVRRINISALSKLRQTNILDYLKDYVV